MTILALGHLGLVPIELGGPRQIPTVAEAAQILGVAQNTLRKWAERGDIPMCKNPANGYRLFKRSDLQKFLKTAATPVQPLRKKHSN